MTVTVKSVYIPTVYVIQDLLLLLVLGTVLFSSSLGLACTVLCKFYAVAHSHFFSLIQAFSNYLAYKRDNNELLLFILRQLSSDHLTFNRNRYGGDFELVEVPEEEFIEKVLACGYLCMTGFKPMSGFVYSCSPIRLQHFKWLVNIHLCMLCCATAVYFPLALISRLSSGLSVGYITATSKAIHF